MLRSARYGLPPPPVPRIQAPIASDSISSAETGRSEAIEGVCYPAAAEAAMKTTRALLVVVALCTFVSGASAFERVGDKKILVFAGRQEVPTIDPSTQYDWSIRMMQQAL